MRGDALAWLECFLSNRRQCTTVGGALSTVSIFDAEVPQGGTLSPLLFSLYLNNIIHGTSADISLFADDTSTYVVAETAPQLQINLQTAIDDLSVWLSDPGLTINRKKITSVGIIKTKLASEDISVPGRRGNTKSRNSQAPGSDPLL